MRSPDRRKGWHCPTCGRRAEWAGDVWERPVTPGEDFWLWFEGRAEGQWGVKFRCRGCGHILEVRKQGIRDLEPEKPIFPKPVIRVKRRREQNVSLGGLGQ